ncbi:MAG TPA: hypothetical protein PKD90_14835 [Phnomibacter sp.]|nr:hypothetical protein [Phnomibacter sp.]
MSNHHAQDADLAQLALHKVHHLNLKEFKDRLDQLENLQPFMLAHALSYQYEFKFKVYKEVLRLYLILWEYMVMAYGEQVAAVTEKQFRTQFNKLLKMLKYSEGEPTREDRMSLYRQDMEQIQNHEIFGLINNQMWSRPKLIHLSNAESFLILSGLKVMLQCLEANTGRGTMRVV